MLLLLALHPVILEMFEHTSYIKQYYFTLIQLCKSCDGSVGIVLGYRLDNWGSRVQFPVVGGNFSLHHHVQNGSGAHPASYPMGIRDSFPGGKVARA
jgi:hypothetical protein